LPRVARQANFTAAGIGLRVIPPAVTVLADASPAGVAVRTRTTGLAGRQVRGPGNVAGGARLAARHADIPALSA